MDLADVENTDPKGNKGVPRVSTASKRNESVYKTSMASLQKLTWVAIGHDHGNDFVQNAIIYSNWNLLY